MTRKTEQIEAALIDEACGLVRKRLPDEQAPQVEESVLHVEVDRQSEAAELETLRGHLVRVLGEVRAAVEDWPAMRERVRGLIAELDEPPASLDRGEVEEAKALLAWLDDRHFTFLG